MQDVESASQSFNQIITALNDKDESVDFLALLEEATDVNEIRNNENEDDRFESWYSLHDEVKAFIDDSHTGFLEILNAAVWVFYSRIREELRNLGMEPEPHSSSIISSLQETKRNSFSNPNFSKLKWSTELISIS